jgi:hypothetical protein
MIIINSKSILDEEISMSARHALTDGDGATKLDFRGENLEFDLCLDSSTLTHM